MVLHIPGSKMLNAPVCQSERVLTGCRMEEVNWHFLGGMPLTGSQLPGLPAEYLQKCSIKL